MTSGLARFVTRPAGAAGPAAPTRPGLPADLPFTPRAPRPPGEGCEMCAEALGPEHGHVVNLDSRRLMCSCRACYLLFTAEGAGHGSYRSVPDRYRVDPGFTLAAADWESLQVPVSLAFFFHNSALGRVVAHYPSPAGATESLLDLAAWDAVAAASPLVAAMEPDVEALVVRRRGQGPTARRDAAAGDFDEAFLVPIDACYELVGRVRMHWTGFGGGPEARAAIAEFFDRLRARSRPLLPGRA
jgi:hypothetical protein